MLSSIRILPRIPTQFVWLQCANVNQPNPVKSPDERFKVIKVNPEPHGYLFKQQRALIIQNPLRLAAEQGNEMPSVRRVEKQQRFIVGQFRIDNERFLDHGALPPAFSAASLRALAAR
jgi:hypothetical protein